MAPDLCLDRAIANVRILSRIEESPFKINGFGDSPLNAAIETAQDPASVAANALSMGRKLYNRLDMGCSMMYRTETAWAVLIKWLLIIANALCVLRYSFCSLDVFLGPSGRAIVLSVHERLSNTQLLQGVPSHMSPLRTVRNRNCRSTCSPENDSASCSGSSKTSKLSQAPTCLRIAFVNSHLPAKVSTPLMSGPADVKAAFKHIRIHHAGSLALTSLSFNVLRFHASSPVAAGSLVLRLVAWLVRDFFTQRGTVSSGA